MGSLSKPSRASMGRVKIPMAYRTDDRARRVTLCKRKKGLYKKAEELAKLCGVEVAIVIVGDSCKPAQMVATGHGNYTDLPRAYSLLQEYTQKVQADELTTPTAAEQVRETLKAQEQKLAEQRREIEELKRELLQHAHKPLPKKVKSNPATGACPSDAGFGGHQMMHDDFEIIDDEELFEF